jgi:peptidoglycan/xylan/chitin deacetylase (PgdA/CDA1 family)
MSILSYHAVDDRSSLPIAVGSRSFAKHGAWLAKHRRMLPLSEATRRLNSSCRLPAGTASITFDDGFASLYDNAVPVLLRYHLPATIFLVAATLAPDGHPVDWVDQPGAHPSLTTLNLDQVLEMQTMGIDFGSHSYDHRDLTSLSDHDCERDLIDSRMLLEDLLKRRIQYLAYPRGRHDERTRRAATRAGYEAGFAMALGGDGVGPYAVPRMGVYRHDTVLSIRMKASPSYVRVRTGTTYRTLRGMIAGASRATA